MFKSISTAVVSVILAGSASAATIMPGSAGIGFTTGFTVDTAAATGVFSADNAFVTVANTTGGFSTPNTAPFPFSFGTFDGTFSFAKTAGDTLTQDLPNLLTFGDISFSASSISTISFTDAPGVSTTGALYLLGFSSKTGFENTATSLTLTFNSTASSAFSASATLATPPAAIGDVPEPASWAMMLVGFGGIGAALRSRRKPAVSFG